MFWILWQKEAATRGGQNSLENTCARVTTYQFQSQSKDRPDKRTSSCWRCPVYKGVLTNLASFTGRHLCWTLFNKFAANQACNFTKIRLQHIFPSEICKIFNNTYFKEHLATDERHQEAHALLGNKNKHHLVNLSRGQWRLP